MKITKQDFEIIKQHYDLLNKWSKGYSTTLTRAVYQELAPVLKRYNYSVGPLSCSYCCLQVCQHAWDIYNTYLDQQKEDKKNKNKEDKHGKEE